MEEEKSDNGEVQKDVKERFYEKKTCKERKVTAKRIRKRRQDYYIRR